MSLRVKKVLKGDEVVGVEVGGWRFEECKCSISESNAIEAFEKEHGITAPEMLYLGNFLRISHAKSSIDVEFNARDALLGTLVVRQPPARDADGKIVDNTVVVKASEEWQRYAKKTLSNRNIDVVPSQTSGVFDWTYTSYYAGSGGAVRKTTETDTKSSSTDPATTTTTSSTIAPSNGEGDDQQQPTEKKRGVSRMTDVKEENSSGDTVDTTSTRSKEESLSTISSEPTGSKASFPQKPKVKVSVDYSFLSDAYTQVTGGWQPGRKGVHVLDMDMLRRRDEFLWYSEVELYKDELHDHGDAHFTVRTRVMPSCWLVLARCFVRVDGVVCRVVATRLFHAFGSNFMVRQTTVQDMTAEEMTARNWPVHPSYYVEQRPQGWQRIPVKWGYTTFLPVSS